MESTSPEPTRSLSIAFLVFWAGYTTVCLAPFLWWLA